jgi:hypothetical protein
LTIPPFDNIIGQTATVVCPFLFAQQEPQNGYSSQNDYGQPNVENQFEGGTKPDNSDNHSENENHNHQYGRTFPARLGLTATLESVL